MLSFDWFFHFYYKIFSRSFGNAFLDFIFMLEPKQNKKTISCFIFTVKTRTCLVMTLSNTELQYTLSLWCLELLYFIISFSVSVSVWNFVWLFAVLFIARFESILYLRHSTIKKASSGKLLNNYLIVMFTYFSRFNYHKEPWAKRRRGS